MSAARLNSKNKMEETDTNMGLKTEDEQFWNKVSLSFSRHRAWEKRDNLNVWDIAESIEKEFERKQDEQRKKEAEEMVKNIDGDGIKNSNDHKDDEEVPKSVRNKKSNVGSKTLSKNKNSKVKSIKFAKVPKTPEERLEKIHFGSAKIVELPDDDEECSGKNGNDIDNELEANGAITKTIKVQKNEQIKKIFLAFDLDARDKIREEKEKAKKKKKDNKARGIGGVDSVIVAGDAEEDDEPIAHNPVKIGTNNTETDTEYEKIKKMKDNYILKAKNMDKEIKDFSNYINEEDDVCENCGSHGLINNANVMVCRDCGSEFGGVTDLRQEWRFYGSEDSKSEDPSRCSGPGDTILSGTSLGTGVLGNNRNFISKHIGWNRRTYKERAIIKIFNNLKARVVGHNIVDRVIRKTIEFYELISKGNINRGKPHKGLIGACLYYACRYYHDMRSQEDIAKIMDVPCKKITTGCKQFKDIMQSRDRNFNNNIVASTAHDFIESYSIKLKLNDLFKGIAIHISDTAHQLGIIAENTPPSIAASSIYLTSVMYKLGITKQMIADKCDICQVTVSKAYKKMYPYRAYLLPVIRMGGNALTQ